MKIYSVEMLLALPDFRPQEAQEGEPANRRERLWTGLCLAAQSGRAEKARSFLDRGASAKHGDSLALRLACRLGHLECAKILAPLSSGWGQGGEHAGTSMFSALDEAAANGFLSCAVEVASTQGIIPDYFSALMASCFFGQIKCVEFFLRRMDASRLDELQELADTVENLALDGCKEVSGLLRARCEAMEIEGSSRAAHSSKPPFRM